MLNILFISSLLALVAGSIPLWLNAMVRKRRTGSLMESRETDGSPFGFLDVIVMFFFWFFGQLATAYFTAYLLGVEINELANLPVEQKPFANIMMASGLLAGTSVALLILLFRYKTLSVFGWQPKNLGRDLVIGGVAFAMVVPAILFAQWLLTQLVDYQHSTLEMLAENAEFSTVAVAWFAAVLVAPICEEIFFRGVLQAWLQRLGTRNLLSDQILTGGWDNVDAGLSKNISGSETNPGKPNQASAGIISGDAISDPNPYSPPASLATKTAAKPGAYSSSVFVSYWPILVSAAIFGLAHIGQGPAPITLFLFGLALGYLYRKTGSIMPCIVLHMLLNGFSMFWFTLQVLFNGEVPALPREMAQLMQCVSQFVSTI